MTRRGLQRDLLALNEPLGTVRIVQANGVGERAVVNSEVREQAVAWLPSGRKILYFASKGKWFGLWSISTHGAHARRLVYALGEPSWARVGS